MAGHVPADPALIAEGRRRALLTRLLSSGGSARITNPDHLDGGWEGKVIGLMDWPSIVLEDSQGRRWTVPQHFAVEEVADGGLRPCSHPWHAGEAAEPDDEVIIDGLAAIAEELADQAGTAEKKLARVRAHIESDQFVGDRPVLLAILDGPEPGPAASRFTPAEGHGCQHPEASDG